MQVSSPAVEVAQSAAVMTDVLQAAASAQTDHAEKVVHATNDLKARGHAPIPEPGKGEMIDIQA